MSFRRRVFWIRYCHWITHIARHSHSNGIQMNATIDLFVVIKCSHNNFPESKKYQIKFRFVHTQSIHLNASNFHTMNTCSLTCSSFCVFFFSFCFYFGAFQSLSLRRLFYKLFVCSSCVCFHNNRSVVWIRCINVYAPQLSARLFSSQIHDLWLFLSWTFFCFFEQCRSDSSNVSLRFFIRSLSPARASYYSFHNSSNFLHTKLYVSAHDSFLKYD